MINKLILVGNLGQDPDLRVCRKITWLILRLDLGCVWML